MDYTCLMIPQNDPSVNEHFLQYQCIKAWERCGTSHFRIYITCVAPNYKTIFFSERATALNHTCMNPSPCPPSALAFTQLSSLCPQCKMGCWIPTKNLIDYGCSLQTVCKSEYHTLFQFPPSITLKFFSTICIPVQTFFCHKKR